MAASSRIETHKRSIFEPVADLMKEVGIPRTSSLSTPIQRLEDHKGPTLSCEFHPDGDIFISAGCDARIHLCGVYSDCKSLMVMGAHEGAVVEAHFSGDGNKIYSGSADRTIGIWDISTGMRIKRLEGHESGVNSVSAPRRRFPILSSGSKDGTVKVWDTRCNGSVLSHDCGYQVNTLCFTANGEQVIYAGNDNDIKIWDIRTNEVQYTLQGHTSTISGTSLSPCGNYLLSHSTDNTLRIWDIRPSVTEERCEKTFSSNQYLVGGNLLRCAWSPDGTMISAGSADRYVCILDSLSGETVRELAGHECGIIDVEFHPREPIVMSSSSDQYIFLHEIED